MERRPLVGVGVIIRKDDEVLLLKRKGAHGAGSWAFVGGHLEFNETPQDCALRETLEEVGLKISNLRPTTFTNDLFDDGNKHYVTLYVLADYIEGEPKILEPEKCEALDWFKWDNLPKPLFIPLQNLLKQDFNPFT
ncbi:NUDIX domain-containing protein [Candidatus Daviesbacteria bacterium]|nr:NUDIX domain-containing protein [Candidatus Daviesbacteria bacterium]